MAEPPVLFDPGADSARWRKRAKQTEAGRLVAALYRRRKLARQLWRARPLRQAWPPAPAPEDRRRVRAICWISAGPGSLTRLLDTWESAQRSSPGELALLVVDDWTHDCTAEAIAAHVPDAVVVRTPFPSVGAPRLWPVAATALKAAHRYFDYDLILKLDDDALVVGPGVVDRIAGEFERARAEADPGALPAGVGGSYGVRPDGIPEGDEEYHTRAVEAEAEHDATMRGWYESALASGWPQGATVQGGALSLTRTLVDALNVSGAVDYVPRLRTIMSDDITLTVATYAHGFRALSMGGPNGPFAFANKHLPLALPKLVDPESPWLVAHSTRIGIDGEPEAEIRAAAREARASWPSPSSV